MINDKRFYKILFSGILIFLFFFGSVGMVWSESGVLEDKSGSGSLSTSNDNFERFIVVKPNHNDQTINYFNVPNNKELIDFMENHREDYGGDNYFYLTPNDFEELKKKNSFNERISLLSSSSITKMPGKSQIKNYNSDRENFQSNPLTHPNRKEFLAAGVTPNTEGMESLLDAIKNKPTDDCSKEENSCKVALKKADEASSLIGAMPPTLIGSHIMNSDLSDEEYEAIEKGLKEKECGDGWTSFICNIFTSVSIEQEVKTSMMQYGNSLRDDKFIEKEVNNMCSGEFSEQPEVCQSYQNKIDECDSNLLDYCDFSAEYRIQLENELLKNKLKTDLSSCDSELCREIKNTLDDEKGPCKNGMDFKCEDAITQKCSDENVGDSEGKNNACTVAKAAIDGAQENTNFKTTDVGMGLLTAIDILSISPEAYQIADMFGIEYKQVNLASTICSAKIDGYFDAVKTTSVGGVEGVTEYGCVEQEDMPYDPYNPYELDASRICLDVIADLRAQRTQVTPDGTSIVAYSSHIKAPADKDINYVISVLYQENGEMKSVALTEMISVKSGGSDSRYDSYPVQNLSEGVNPDSFYIGLIAKYVDSGATYKFLKYKIPLITSGNYYTPLYEVPSESEDSPSSPADDGWGGDGPDMDDFLSEWG